MGLSSEKRKKTKEWQENWEKERWLTNRLNGVKAGTKLKQSIVYCSIAPWLCDLKNNTLSQLHFASFTAARIIFPPSKSVWISARLRSRKIHRYKERDEKNVVRGREMSIPLFPLSENRRKKKAEHERLEQNQSIPRFPLSEKQEEKENGTWKTITSGNPSPPILRKTGNKERKRDMKEEGKCQSFASHSLKNRKKRKKTGHEGTEQVNPSLHILRKKTGNKEYKNRDTKEQYKI